MFTSRDLYRYVKENFKRLDNEARNKLVNINN